MRFTLIFLLLTVLGCTRDKDTELNRLLNESLGVSVSNLHDLEELERGFLGRFPLGTLKQDLQKALAQLDPDSGVYFFEVDDEIIVEINMGEGGYIQTGFLFNGQDLSRVNSVATNLSVKMSTM